MMKIDHKKASELFSYNPETGKLYRKVEYASKGLRPGEPGTIRQAGENLYYRVIVVDGVGYLAHRLAWLLQTGRYPKGEVDHIDGDGLNNKWSNLRDVTRKENSRNRRLAKNNKSGITGVRRIEKENSWEASIWKEKAVKLYYGKDFFEACCARKSAEKKLGFHENHGKPRLR